MGLKCATSGNISPILDLKPQSFKSSEHQRRALDELARLNQQHLNSLGSDDQRLKARMENYELAFRMQTEVPNLVDLHQESQDTLNMYGLDEPETDVFGRQCLMARRKRRSVCANFQWWVGQPRLSRARSHIAD